MNLMTVDNIVKTYTDRILLDHVSFGINEGDKIGVVGINGTGKSTLLKILAGEEDADAGNVIKGRKVRLAYLEQTPVFDEEVTILENVLRGKKAEEEHRNLEGEARAMLLKLGISEPEESTRHLSGGQKKRVALVRTLLTPAEVLILDEPTNHLDNEMAEWLEEYLRKYKGAFIMVTHDRYFLDKAANRILEIDKGNVYMYTANYSKFVELKAAREDMEIATERKKKSLYRMELEWMMRGARARSTKQKAHIRRFEELADRKKVETDGSVEINALSSRLGRKTVEMNGISKAFGENVLIKDFTYIFLPEDRIGIIGPNGCGKSTLLKIITGKIEADSGSIEIGQTVKIGYFSQENEEVDGEARVIDYIRDTAEYIRTDEGEVTASQMLEQFLFTGAMQYSPVSKLSGGEKRRLYLLKILMEAPNILILDEPTNDLDISTLTILENYLESFDGIVAAVSHDRYFLDKMAGRIFSFEGDGQIKQYEGNFSDYREKSSVVSPAITGSAETAKEKHSSRQSREEKLRFTYMEKKEYELIDGEISSLEEEIGKKEKEIAAFATSYSKLNALMEEKQALEKTLDEKMERWLYLNDMAEKILEQGGRL